MTRSVMGRSRAFYALVASQFMGSLADNALLIVAIGLLVERHAAAWMAPALRIFFYLSFVLTAAFAGAVADAFPKGRVVLAANAVKLLGCVLMMAQVHPLLAYALAGLGAAAHSPARYGILPELLPPGELVAANAWMEISGLLSILLGVALAALLVSSHAALPVIGALYLAAVVFSAAISRRPAANPQALDRPAALVSEFARAFMVLWRDAQGQISLAVTCLFWAVAAALQFLVLRWADDLLGLPLAQGALLQIAVAVGMAAGAAGAARYVTLGNTLSLLPLGAGMGVLLLAMNWVGSVWLAVAVLFAIGAIAGVFVIPMNALLQHRGQVLMHPGQSVAVQNFNECLASLVFLAIYAGVATAGYSIRQTLGGVAALVGAAMLLIALRHRANLGRASTFRPDTATKSLPTFPG